MLRNYWTVTWRNLIRHRTFSFVNIFGLALGLAASFVLLLYGVQELSYDRFHPQYSQLYQLWNHQLVEGEVLSEDRVPSPLAPKLLQSVPEIKRVARTFPQTNRIKGAQSTRQKGLYVDPAFLAMFSFPLLKGDPKTVLQQPNSILLTRSTARTLFGHQDPIDQVVTFEDAYPLKVTGILADLPTAYTFQFDFLVPWALWEKRFQWKSDQEWGYYSFPTYVELTRQANPGRVNDKIRNGVRSRPEGADRTLFLHPMSQWHLYSEFKGGQNVGGRITYVRLFLALALGILLIAGVNYTNLSTARSRRRAREVGIRKVVGATRRALTGQFLGESVGVSLLALVLAWLMVQLALPYFNRLTGTLLTIDYRNPAHWLGALGTALLTGLVAGSYPAFYLSSFQPVRVLKGIRQPGSAALRARQVLVVGQFSFAIALIIGSVLIYQQLHYIQNRPVGYRKAGLIQLPLEGNLDRDFGRFRSAVIESGAVTEACATSSLITDANSNTALEWPGQRPAEKYILFDQIQATHSFVATFGVKIKRGRGFSPAFATDSSAVLLNETAARLTRLKDPIGQIVNWQGESRRVVGVFEDFVWDSPFEPARPMVVAFTSGGASAFALRLNPARSLSAGLRQVERVYQQFNPAFPFEYQFVEESFARKLRFETLLGSLANWFAGLAVFISCLGLFGLATFSVEQRRQEVGIRKVLGATLAQLWFTLAGDFLRPVLGSFLLAAPAAYWLMHRWLQKYPYRTEISGWVFVLAGWGALLIALLTVSFQVLKAARANPVKSLRIE